MIYTCFYWLRETNWWSPKELWCVFRDEYISWAIEWWGHNIMDNSGKTSFNFEIVELEKNMSILAVKSLYLQLTHASDSNRKTVTSAMVYFLIVLCVHSLKDFLFKFNWLFCFRFSHFFFREVGLYKLWIECCVWITNKHPLSLLRNCSIVVGHKNISFCSCNGDKLYI